MRVAALASTFPARSETFVLNQISGLVDRGCEVDVFANSQGTSPDDALHSRELASATTYHDVPSGIFARTRRATAAWRRLAAQSRVREGAIDVPRHGRHALGLRLLIEAGDFAGRGRYDVVHAHFGSSGARAVKLREIGALDGPIVTTFYGHDASRIRSGDSYGSLFQHGDRFLVLSRFMRDRLVALGCDGRRIVIHPIGVDTRRIAPERSTRQSGFHVISVARFVEKKGLTYGLDAIALLRESVPDIRCTIVGDGPLRQTLVDRARSLGLGDVVSFVGWQSHRDTIALMRTADVLLAPSVRAANDDAEGTPMVIIEAQALAIPVVSTMHEGIPEIVATGESGLLVTERDPKALAHALAQIHGSEIDRRRMGEAGRAIVEARHDIERLNDRLIEIYSGIAAGRSSVSADG